MILAAGASRRFGDAHSKLLLSFAGKTLLQHAIDTAAQSHAMSCTLVLGADADRTLEMIDARRCSVVRNEQWKEGIASSLRAGLAQHRDDEACIFMVADQPHVTAADLNRLIAHHLAERDAIVALRAGKVWGTPMLFPQRDFPGLDGLRGDTGAKRLAQGQQQRLRYIPALSEAAFEDVDTLADYERLGQIEPRT